DNGPIFIGSLDECVSLICTFEPPDVSEILLLNRPSELLATLKLSVIVAEYLVLTMSLGQLAIITKSVVPFILFVLVKSELLIVGKVIFELFTTHVEVEIV